VLALAAAGTNSPSHNLKALRAAARAGLNRSVLRKPSAQHRESPGEKPSNAAVEHTAGAARGAPDKVPSPAHAQQGPKQTPASSAARKPGSPGPAACATKATTAKALTSPAEGAGSCRSPSTGIDNVALEEAEAADPELAALPAPIREHVFRANLKLGGYKMRENKQLANQMFIVIKQESRVLGQTNVCPRSLRMEWDLVRLVLMSEAPLLVECWDRGQHDTLIGSFTAAVDTFLTKDAEFTLKADTLMANGSTMGRVIVHSA